MKLKILLILILCVITLTGCSNSKNDELLKEKTNNNIYYLETSILNLLNDLKSSDIDWDDVKVKVEQIYPIWNSLILDMSKLSINDNNILEFSGRLDTVAKHINEKDRLRSIYSVTNLFEYLPQFVEEYWEDLGLVQMLYAKASIVRSYALVEVDDWAGALEESNKAEQNLLVIMNSININENKMYNVEKVYVLLKELQISISEEEKDIFRIKYNNLLREMD